MSPIKMTGKHDDGERTGMKQCGPLVRCLPVMVLNDGSNSNR